MLNRISTSIKFNILELIYIYIILKRRKYLFSVPRACSEQPRVRNPVKKLYRGWIQFWEEALSFVYRWKKKGRKWKQV